MKMARWLVYRDNSADVGGTEGTYIGAQYIMVPKEPSGGCLKRGARRTRSLSGPSEVIHFKTYLEATCVSEYEYGEARYSAQ